MATTATAPAYAPVESYIGESGLWSWLTTVDHKRIGTLYLFSSLFFFLVGGIEAGVNVFSSPIHPAVSQSVGQPIYTRTAISMQRPPTNGTEMPQ